MSELSFILISDHAEVEEDLRGQLNMVGEFYQLTRISYAEAPACLNSRKYDRIFASLSKDNLKEQGNYLLALGRTATPVTILEQDKTATQAIAKMQQRSPGLESVAQSCLAENSGLLHTFFGYSIEYQREQRMRSDARSKESIEQWQKISKLEITVQRLVDDQEKMENYFYGTTSPDGRDNSILAAASWVVKNQDELVKLQAEVGDLKKYVAEIEERKATSWQTKLAIFLALLGLAGSISSAFVPLVFDDSEAPSVSK
jgi:hypothetical protein